MEISEFQELIRITYIHHDVRRGIDNTFFWLKSEVDELEEAIKAEDIENQKEEIVDVLAWGLGNVDKYEHFPSPSLRILYHQGLPPIN